MSAAISDATRNYLSASLSLVERHREDLVSRTEASLEAGEPNDEPYGQSQMVAMILSELLLAQVRCLVETGDLACLRDVDAEHRALGISGRHYSCFGDMLVPILKDLLGPNVPSGVTSAWSDAFWVVIRAAQDRAAPDETAHDQNQMALA